MSLAFYWGVLCDLREGSFEVQIKNNHTNISYCLCFLDLYACCGLVSAVLFGFLSLCSLLYHLLRD